MYDGTMAQWLESHRVVAQITGPVIVLMCKLPKAWWTTNNYRIQIAALLRMFSIFQAPCE